MSLETINEIIGKKAFNQVDQMSESLVKLSDSFVKAAESASKVELNFRGTSELKELLSMMGEVTKAQGQMKDAYAAFDAAQKKKIQNDIAEEKLAQQKLKTKIEDEKLTKQQAQTRATLENLEKKTAQNIEKETKNIEKLSNAYEQLKKEYSEAANLSKRLGAEYFNLQRSGTATIAQLKDLGGNYRNATKSANGLHRELLNIETAVGQSQRNVGNYNGLMTETQQIMRELPNFAISARIGIQSLSNNLPMFAESFTKASRAIDATTGKAVGFAGALKQMGASLFSWPTLIIGLTTLLVAYGDQIFKVIKGLGGLGEASEKVKASMESLKDVEKEETRAAAEQIGTLRQLQRTMTDTNLSMRQRTLAYEEAVRLYPAYLADVSKDEALNGGLADTIENRLVPAILAAAKARAYQQKINALTATQIELEEDQLKVTRERAKALEEYNKVVRLSSSADGLEVSQSQFGGAGNTFDIGRRAKAAKADVEDLTDAVNENAKARLQLQKTLEDYARKASSFTEKAGDLAPGTNSPRAKAAADTTKAEIKATESLIKSLAELDKQRLETDMAANRAIYENESNSLADRLAAYAKFVEDKEKIVELDGRTELSSLNVKLDKIAEIEKKAESKRTNQEKSLLLDKAALLAQQLTLEERNTLQISQIRSDAQQQERAIIQSDTENRVREMQLQFDQIRQNVDAETTYELKALEERRQKGLLTDKRFWIERNKLVASQSKAMLDWQLAVIKDEYDKILNDPTAPQAVKDAVIKIYGDLEKLRSQLEAKGKVSGGGIMEMLGFGEKTVQEQERMIAESIQSLYNSLMSSLDVQRRRAFQKRKDEIEEQSELLTQSFEEERKAVESSALSYDEKQKKLEEIDARRLASERAIDNQRKQMQREEAERAKRDALFQAAIQGGIAVAKALSSGPPPGNFIVAAAVGAASLATLALIAAEPIPQYWKGTGPEGHKGGPAIVGERGTELGILPSGQMFLTPSRSTLMDLPAGTEIIPNHELSKEATRNAIAQMHYEERMAGPAQAHIDMAYLENALMKNGMMIVKAIKEKPETQLMWENGQMIKMIKHMNGWTKHIGGIA